MAAENQTSDSVTEPVSEAIQANIDKLVQFEKRQSDKRSRIQKIIEAVSLFFSSPRFFLSFVVMSLSWLGINVALHRAGHPYLDEPPFFILQGIVSYTGVLITMAVLIRQNRLAHVEESRAHLELQVNLLAEQKTSKIIMLLEELRRDMPGVHDRHDEQATTLQTMTNPDTVLDEIENRTVAAEEQKEASGE